MVMIRGPEYFLPSIRRHGISVKYSSSQQVHAKAQSQPPVQPHKSPRLAYAKAVLIFLMSHRGCEGKLHLAGGVFDLREG
jgi:hypothetical protein